MASMQHMDLEQHIEIHAACLRTSLCRSGNPLLVCFAETKPEMPRDASCDDACVDRASHPRDDPRASTAMRPCHNATGLNLHRGIMFAPLQPRGPTSSLHQSPASTSQCLPSLRQGQRQRSLLLRQASSQVHDFAEWREEMPVQEDDEQEGIIASMRSVPTPVLTPQKVSGLDAWAEGGACGH